MKYLLDEDTVAKKAVRPRKEKRKNEAHTERVGMNKKSLQGQKTSKHARCALAQDSVAGIEEAYLRVSRLQCQVSILLDNILQDTPADLDETALQYIDPELVRRKRYAASVCVYDCIGLEMLKHCSDAPMLEWWPYRMEYLMESMRAEGRGEAASWEKCPTQGEFSNSGIGKGLTLVGQKWNGEYFECTTLQALGLRIQLGHLKGECVNPERGSRSFTVLHTNRVHLVNIDFCRCDQHVSDRQQLLQSRWYPATVYYPKTCATIELLNQFHILMLAGKISHHEFYLSLERLTDNLEINTPNVSTRLLAHDLE
ncbi:hypothetical protein IMY05_C3416001100 [Salix suchowensis]|nr:hypothetical protein IMY05_C3416001100 [Salix suchowensis]